MKNKEKIIILFAILVLVVFFMIVIMFGLRKNEQSENTQENTVSEIVNEEVNENLDEYDLKSSYDSSAIKIELSDNNSTSESNNVVIEDNVITIKKSGTYEISGTLTDGNIIVDTDKESIVRIILNNANIKSSNTSPIFVKSAEKVILTINDESTNNLEDSKDYIIDETEEPDSTIYSKDDLTINGTGNLNIKSNYNDAIICKDTLKILDINLNITSVDDGIKGKDFLYIKGASITIESSGDGIKSTNDTDSSLGNLNIDSAKLNIISKQDAIQSENILNILNCNIEIKTGDGSEAALKESSNNLKGFIDKYETQSASDNEASMKGIKAVNGINIDGGSYSIDSQDDAIHSNGTLVINSGEFSILSGDDGIHADTNININGGTINIKKSYEGIESANIVISNGNIHVISQDDGINVAGGNDSSAMNGRMGQNAFTKSEDSNYALKITGGYIYVDSTGDGLDSNGKIEMSDGIVIVDGPTNSGNGALDYDSTFNITGGTLIAAGTSGMMQTVSNGSTQNTITVVFNETKDANTLVNIQNSNGDDIITYSPSKSFGSIVISSPKLTNGSDYKLNVGGSYSKESEDGYYIDGIYSNGTLYETFDISGILTSIGNVKSNQMPMGGGKSPRM